MTAHALRLWMALWLGFVLSSCTDSPPLQRPAYFAPQNFSSSYVENELKTASFLCGSQACPENVGMIYSQMNGANLKSQLLQCTGFLVQNNIVVTNSHCVPDAIKLNGQPCQGLMAIKFIRSSGKQDIFSCRRMISFSNLNTQKISLDYAYFEIAASGISPTVISQESVSDRQKIKVIKVNPNEKGGTLVTELCEVGLSSPMNFFGAKPWTKNNIAVLCQSSLGNSGSPVFNESNKVIGVLQSAYTQAQLDEVRRLAPPEIRVPERLSAHFIWTNLACVPHPLTGMYAEDKCEDLYQSSADDWMTF